jgi:hypothetical protein
MQMASCCEVPGPSGRCPRGVDRLVDLSVDAIAGTEGGCKLEATGTANSSCSVHCMCRRNGGAVEGSNRGIKAVDRAVRGPRRFGGFFFGVAAFFVEWNHSWISWTMNVTQGVLGTLHLPLYKWLIFFHYSVPHRPCLEGSECRQEKQSGRRAE